jgi:hypothetical protein
LSFLTHNPKVGGSNPSPAMNDNNKLQMKKAAKSRLF